MKFVTTITKDILKILDYTLILIYPFLIYGLIAWGNSYTTTFQPIYILQKKAVRFLTFSSFDHHSSPLFKLLGIIIFPDLGKSHIGVFMYKYHNQLLPSVFNSFFTKVDQVHVIIHGMLLKCTNKLWKIQHSFSRP